jgi:SWI/SNF-related matrix-associated actin-dependent regulator of chromatin subfamily A-like protein 1
MSSTAPTKAPPPTVTVPGGQLYPYQVENLQYLKAHQGRALIADEMGLGKTASALAWFHYHPQLRPVVIVCPASVKLQWPLQAKKWLGLSDEDISVLKGRKGPVPTGSIIVCNYDILKPRLDQLLALNPKIIIFDESHLIKEERASRSAASLALASAPSVESVLALTGTPILSRPKELWHQALVVNPQVWPNFFKYAFRYCNPVRRDFFIREGKGARGTAWDFTGASNVDELDTKLRNKLMIRHRKADVMGDLPEVTNSTIPFDVDLTEYRKYRATVRARLMEIREQLRRERANIKSLPPLEQLEALSARAEANSTLKLYGYMLGEIALLRQEAARAKLPSVLTWVQEFVESGEPLVLFTHHHQISDALGIHLGEMLRTEIPVLDGRISLKKRQEAVTAFVQGESPVIVAGIKAMGTGIDGLQHAASNCAFVEISWTPADHDQATARLHRQGQQNAVSAYYLVAADTIEQDMAHLLDAKSTVVSAAMGGMEDYRILESLVDLILEGG